MVLQKQGALLLHGLNVLFLFGGGAWLAAHAVLFLLGSGARLAAHALFEEGPDEDALLVQAIAPETEHTTALASTDRAGVKLLGRQCLGLPQSMLDVWPVQFAALHFASHAQLTQGRETTQGLGKAVAGGIGVERCHHLGQGLAAELLGHRQELLERQQHGIRVLLIDVAIGRDAKRGAQGHLLFFWHALGGGIHQGLNLGQERAFARRVAGLVDGDERREGVGLQGQPCRSSRSVSSRASSRH